MSTAMGTPRQGSELLRICSSGGKQNTVLFVTHAIPEAIFLFDQVIVMSRHPAVIVGDVHIAIERPRTLEKRGSRQLGD